MRLRKNETIRRMLKEYELKVDNLIIPYFIKEGKNVKESIKYFPGIFHLSIDNLLKEIDEISNLKIPAVLLFGICDKKDEFGSESWNSEGIIQKGIRELKKRFPGIVIMTDVCLCGYKLDSHCGIFKKEIKEKKDVETNNYIIDKKATLKALSKIALSHAYAGADFVSPSAMMDGQVGVIRKELDNKNFNEVGILAYSAKFASGFYRPFREALNSSPKFGDRKSYQLDYSSSRDAFAKIEQDIKEGADIVMVKPAIAYLDIIKEAKQKFNNPIAAYNVSGEYSMIKNSAAGGFINEKEIVFEILTSIKRAGADLIITYHAKDVAKWLKEN